MNDTEGYTFKSKDSEIVEFPLCLGSISKDWSADNMKKKTAFNGYVYDFSVDYDATDVDDIKKIHKYLMKKNDMYQWKYLDLLKTFFFTGLTFYQISQMQFHWM